MAKAIDSAETPDAASDLTDPVAVSVVLPAYNEADNLERLIPEIDATLQRLDRGAWEIVIVDDGSTDATAATAAQGAALYPPVRVVALQANYGQSAALAAGIDHARGDVIVTMDADGQNDPADIPRLIDRLDAGADCVSGWRRDRADPLGKRLASAVQTRLAQATGPAIHDFGCTLTAYRAEAIDEADLRGERHRYIPAELHALGYDVTELEVAHRERDHGTSHYGPGRLLRGLVDLGYQLFRVRWRTRPMHFFGGLGVAAGAIGVFLGAWLIAQRYLAGVAISANLPKLILAVTLCLTGLGLFSLGVITELLTEILWDGKRPYRVDEVID